MHLQIPSGFKTAYEEAYTHLDSNEWGRMGKFSTLPVLIETPYSRVLISESNVADYPCMFLQGVSYGLSSAFPKLPVEFGDDGDRSLKILKEADCIARTVGRRDYPWRYFIVAKDDKTLLKTSMPYKLAEESQIRDVSWIKPGQVSWEWWNGCAPYGKDVNFSTGCNTETYQYYIDFASMAAALYLDSLGYDVKYANCGMSGYTTYNFLPPGRAFQKVVSAADSIYKKGEMLVFSMKLGTNDSAWSNESWDR